jgi:entericidin B
MFKTTAKVLLALATLGLGSSLLSACNTVEGVGQDVQAGGRALENSSDNVRRRM